jgi:ribosomal protein L24
MVGIGAGTRGGLLRTLKRTHFTKKHDLPEKFKRVPQTLAKYEQSRESPRMVKLLKDSLKENGMKPLEQSYPLLQGDEVIITKGTSSEVGKRGKIQQLLLPKKAAIVEGLGFRQVSGRVIQVPLPLDGMKLINAQTRLPVSKPLLRWVHHENGALAKERVTHTGLVLPRQEPPSQETYDSTKATRYTDIQSLPSMDQVEEEEIQAQVQRKVAWLKEQYLLELEDKRQSDLEQQRKEIRLRQEFKLRVYLRALEILRKRNQERQQAAANGDIFASEVPTIPLPPPPPFRFQAINYRPASNLKSTSPAGGQPQPSSSFPQQS